MRNENNQVTIPSGIFSLIKFGVASVCAVGNLIPWVCRKLHSNEIISSQVPISLKKRKGLDRGSK
jgi:hypothetical protein